MRRVIQNQKSAFAEGWVMISCGQRNSKNSLQLRSRVVVQ